MGNKITYHSPSRGCSMELGAAITVLVFSQYSLPVSTSMCITGATVGVGTIAVVLALGPLVDLSSRLMRLDVHQT